MKYRLWGEREVTVAPLGMRYLLQSRCPAVGSPLLTMRLQRGCGADLGLAGLAWGTQPPAYGLKKATVSGPIRHQSQARPGLVTSGLPGTTHLYSLIIKSKRAEGLSQLLLNDQTHVLCGCRDPRGGPRGTYKR